MCTYLTEKITIEGSGKDANGWFALREAVVYVDHPQHAPYEHTLNIDFADYRSGPSARVAVELTEASALALVEAIHAALASAPPGLAAQPPPAPSPEAESEHRGLDHTARRGLARFAELEEG